MSAVASIIGLDLRGIRRDHVALATVLLSVLGTVAITVVGAIPQRPSGWSTWFPFIVAVSLLGGPSGFGFLFGLLMVEETDTGVRDALAVMPVPPGRFLLVRTVVVTTWVAAWSLTSVYLMNWSWQGVDLSLSSWLAVVIPLALFTPAFALLIPALARDKVGALAVFKGLSFLTLTPLARFLVSDDAVYRFLFLVSPTGWVIEAYRAFLAHVPTSGAGWATGALVYAAALLAIVVALFRRRVYRLYQ
jgi:hypothetical protein